MAVLLECAACYQSYVVPTQDLGRRSSCPWCGAASYEAASSEAERCEAAPATESPFAPAIAAIPAFDTAPPAKAESNGHAGRGDIVGGGSLLFVDTAAAFPALGPSRFPRRRRGTPAVLWMLVGIGLGACVVLAALAVWTPDVFHREDASDSERPQVIHVHVATHPVQAAGSPPGDRSPAAPRVNVDQQREIVQRALGEINGGAIERPRESKNGTVPRWLSDKPPPIGDPGDDSPGLGIKLRDRTIDTTSRTAPRASRSPDANSAMASHDGKPPAPVTDDSAAITALAAAGIRCDKDATTGRVTRVDGSFRMTDALMPHVAKLRGLSQLKLSFSDVTDAGLAHVKELTGLQELILNETKVTDAGLANLENLIALEKLDLEKTSASDACLGQLKKLKRLKHLDLRGTKVSPAGIEQLEEALAEARIRK